MTKITGAYGVKDTQKLENILRCGYFIYSGMLNLLVSCQLKIPVFTHMAVH